MNSVKPFIYYTAISDSFEQSNSFFTTLIRSKFNPRQHIQFKGEFPAKETLQDSIANYPHVQTLIVDQSLSKTQQSNLISALEAPNTWSLKKIPNVYVFSRYVYNINSVDIMRENLTNISLLQPHHCNNRFKHIEECPNLKSINITFSENTNTKTSTKILLNAPKVNLSGNSTRCGMEVQFPQRSLNYLDSFVVETYYQDSFLSFSEKTIEDECFYVIQRRPSKSL